MTEAKRMKRRILTAGAGMVAITAVEGLACGNPVSPRYDLPLDQEPEATQAVADEETPPATSASASASGSAAGTAAASASASAPVEVPPAGSALVSDPGKP